MQLHHDDEIDRDAIKGDSPQNYDIVALDETPKVESIPFGDHDCLSAVGDNLHRQDFASEIGNDASNFADESDHAARRATRHNKQIVALVLILTVSAVTLIGIGIHNAVYKTDNVSYSDYDENLITSQPTASPTTKYETIINKALKELIGEKAACFQRETNQWKARTWLIEKDYQNTIITPINSEDQDRLIQRYALMTMYFSFGGKESRGIDWIAGDECDSKIIKCNDFNSIRVLELDGNVVTAGTIPPEIGLLTSLENLIIKNNEKLVGSIPIEVENLVESRQIGIYNNSIEGTIPNEICGLSKLIYLNLANNKMTGRVPNEFGLLSNLQKLILDENHLTGHITPIKYRTMNLRLLSLSGNSFAGTLPSAMRFLKSLEYLYLDHNDFSGVVPLEVGMLTNLNSLALGNNRFQSSLPKELNSLKRLEFLSLNDNDLTGQIQETLVMNLTKLTHLYLHGNQFTGSIPSAMSTLSELKVLSLNSNNFSGSIKEIWNYKLEQLSLSDNSFTGTLPGRLCNLTQLEELFLSSNQLNGTVDDCIGGLTKLRQLHLYGNEFSGTVPSSLDRLNNLGKFCRRSVYLLLLYVVFLTMF